MSNDRKRLQHARTTMARARLQHFLGDSRAETTARDGLRQLRSAMNWLEDTPEFEVAHYRLDEAGDWVNRTFGCFLEWDASELQYWRVCPVGLAHLRVGMSVELVDVERICTVCGVDPRDCLHATFRTYQATRFELVGGECNVCLQEGCLEHVEGETYNIVCVHVITGFGMEGIAVVSRPAIPDARIEKVSISLREAAAVVGLTFTPGMPVPCRECRRDLPCTGVRDDWR